MRVRAIDFVITNVTDIERAKAFYRDVLGIENPVASEGEGWIEFDTRPVALALGITPEGWPKPPVTAIALAVDDVHAAVEELRAQGVTILSGPMETPVCTLAYITDPDGNPIFLHRRHDGTAG